MNTSYKVQLKLKPKRQTGTNYRKITVKKEREKDKNQKSGFPAGSVVKDPSANARRHGFNP